MKFPIAMAILLASPAIQAAEAVAPVAQVAVSRPQAHQLADVLVAPDYVEQQSDMALRMMAAEMFRSDPVLSTLSDTYQGLEQDFIVALRPIIFEEINAKVPPYKAELAGFFSERFTDKELAQLVAFWTSDAARAFLGKVGELARYEAMTKEMVAQIDEGGDMAISENAMKADVQDAAAAALRSLSRKHMSAFIAFGLTPTGKKFGRLAKEKQAIDLKWANDPLSPAAGMKIEAAVDQLMRRYLESDMADTEAMT